MNKVLMILICSWVMLSSNGITKSAPLFNVASSGPAGTISITLCLNGDGPISCQQFNVPSLNLAITTTIPNHTYLRAGIKINTPGYKIINNTETCTLTKHGYCLFSVSKVLVKNFSIFPLLGSSYQGGVVACMGGVPNMNFVVASTDSTRGIPWGGFSISTGANSSTNGAVNSRLILNAGVVNSAVNLCSGSINGYNDWFLPARAQLDCVAQNQNVIPNLMNAIYWSSTEQDAEHALFQFFDNENQLSIFKTFYASVRCARIPT